MPPTLADARFPPWNTPAMNRIPAHDLLPGDVLLYHGSGLTSRLIRLFDGTDYSHASIFDGNQIVEAISSGIVQRSVTASAVHAEYIHVYRFLSATKEPLGSAAYPTDPLVSRIEHYVTHRQRYAYEQILLLALLASTRRIPIPGVAWLLRNVLDEAMRLVSTLIAAGREPVICSELVYRIFSEAQGDNYTLSIRGADTLAATAARTVQGMGTATLTMAETDATAAEASALQEDAAAFLRLFTAAKHQAVHDNDGQPVFGAQAVADFVTPGDLKKSPNLALQGQLVLD